MSELGEPPKAVMEDSLGGCPPTEDDTDSDVAVEQGG